MSISLKNLEDRVKALEGKINSGTSNLRIETLIEPNLGAWGYKKYTLPKSIYDFDLICFEISDDSNKYICHNFFVSSLIKFNKSYQTYQYGADGGEIIFNTATMFESYRETTKLLKVCGINIGLKL